jgi:hypothetical protein
LTKRLESGKWHLRTIIVAQFNFSCSLWAILKIRQIGENKMKIAMRMLVLAGLLVAGIYSQITFTGPGTPTQPPVAVVL